MGLYAGMPGDQAGDDALSVCFDGAVVEEPLDLPGAARVALTVSSDQPPGFVLARLCDVGPDGRSVRIAHGMLNLCHRASMAAPAPMVPGQVVEVALDLEQMAYRVAAGHRIRLALSNSYWPFVWASPVAGVVMVSTVSLDLPVHAGSGAEWAPQEALHAAPGAHRVLRVGNSARRVETDLLTGRVVLVVEEDGGEVDNPDHGLVSGESLTDRREFTPMTRWRRRPGMSGSSGCHPGNGRCCARGLGPR